MWWHEFAQAAPVLAARLREEFERAGVVLVELSSRLAVS